MCPHRLIRSANAGNFPIPSNERKGGIMAGTFEVYEDKAGRFRFRPEFGNGEIVAVGEAYVMS